MIPVMVVPLFDAIGKIELKLSTKAISSGMAFLRQLRSLMLLLDAQDLERCYPASARRKAVRLLQGHRLSHHCGISLD